MNWTIYQTNSTNQNPANYQIRDESPWNYETLGYAKSKIILCSHFLSRNALLRVRANTNKVNYKINQHSLKLLSPKTSVDFLLVKCLYSYNHDN